MARLSRAVLLDPRAPRRRVVDLVTRAPFIPKQRHPARRMRQARQSLRLLLPVMVTGLGLAALGVAGATGAHALRTAALFAVARVDVVGAHRVDERRVIEAALIESGSSLFGVDPANVRARVEALPGVERARVVRHLPNRIAIILEEREPYALVSVPGTAGPNGLYWIDASGRLVERERQPSVPRLPILSGVELPRHESDAPLPDRLRTGLALLRAVQRTGERAIRAISEIDVGQPENPILYTLDGTAVRLGQPAWEEKLARLDGVLAELRDRGEQVQWIDLRFRDQVVLKPHPVVPVGPSAGVGTAGGRRPVAVNGPDSARERR